MMNRKLYFSMVAGIFLALSASTFFQAEAAPAMPHNICRVTGTITSAETIEIERGGPKSWRDSWGVSESYHETEIKLDVRDIKIVEDKGFNDTSCTLERTEKGYYLKENSMLKEFSTNFAVGDCITAETNYSGDEFRIGNWIYNIEKLSAAACEEDYPDTE